MIFNPDWLKPLYQDLRKSVFGPLSLRERVRVRGLKKTRNFSF
jgi:hypothetical protein